MTKKQLMTENFNKNLRLKNIYPSFANSPYHV